MVKTRLVVFDMAGTTVNENKIVYKSVCQALNNVGIAIDYLQVLSEIAGWKKKDGIAHLAEKYLDHPSDASKEQIYQDFLKIVESEYQTNETICEMEGASLVFRTLKNKNIKVALNTGYQRSTADLLIEKIGWKRDGLIDFSITSDEVEKGRPHPDMIREIMSVLNIQDPQTVMKVGDTPADVEEGHNAECGKVVAIINNNPNEAKILAKKPTHTISRLQELLEII